MTMYDYVWLCMTMYDYVWLCMTMYNYVWLCIMYANKWVCLCMTVYDYVWLCIAMYGYVWLYMTMYDQIIVLEYECVCFRIHITCSTLWHTVDDNCYATTKTSKNEK